MIKSISIRNMRLFESFEIDEFKRFNLIVGGANSGKTSLIESLFLLIGASNPQLAPRINGYRNISMASSQFWSSLFRNLDMNNEIVISGQLQVGGESESRRLTLKPYYGGERPNGKTGDESELRQPSVSSLSKPEATGVEYHTEMHRGGAVTEAFDLYVAEFGAGPLRWSQPNDYEEPILGIYLGPMTMGSGLVDRFSNLVISKEVDEVLEVMRKLDPRIKKLELAEEQIWCDVDLPKLVPLGLWGGGFHNLLSIMLAFHNCKNGVVLLDEIETGLHYSGMDLLWRATKEAARKFDVQVIATTHSYECVRAFNSVAREELAIQDDHALFRLEREREQTNVIRIGMDALDAAIDSNWEVR